MTKLALPKPVSSEPESLLQALVLFGDELDRRLAFGTATFTWPGGSATSDTTTVAHGLSFAPVSVLLTPGARSGVTFHPAVGVTGKDATNFTANATTIDGGSPAVSSTVAFDWLAIR